MFRTPVALSSFGFGPSISFSSNSGDVASSVPVCVRGEGCAGATLRRLEKVQRKKRRNEEVHSRVSTFYKRKGETYCRMWVMRRGRCLQET